MRADKLILVTAATGYVGDRLLPPLMEDGWRVRCLEPQPERLSSRVPADVEVVPGDMLEGASLSLAMQGVEDACYLVHSMGATGDFEEQHRLVADNCAAAAAGVRRILYLGGLSEDEAGLSAHFAIGDVLNYLRGARRSRPATAASSSRSARWIRFPAATPRW
jgi:uncharacterized protein YbjT (DUF2867 family)